ncbi:MAG: gliding motility-associated C-terminal domain-containing protein [Flavobacteriales bacterium]|nr:gliding motility-associated C-terminal domain-containing protein [Flavobacteriales bacterium]
MNFLGRIFSILALLLSFHSMVAQDSEFIIENGSVTTCSGYFVDDGNEGPYSGTGYTFTICPDTPGDVIQIDFAVFQLFSVGNNSDWLFIYDGDYVDDAINVGAYTGDDLQGLSITGTVNNVSGCMTFVFQPGAGNPTDLPGWTGVISCTTPCATPFAASEILDPAPDNPGIQTVGVCLDQPITFADNGSTAEPGFSLSQYIWNFGDGTIDTLSGAQVEHAFTEPGEYIVTLAVEDNNGCQSVNIDPLQVLVSTIPEFNTVWNPTLCLGGSDPLDGTAIQSVTWTALPPQVVGEQMFISDDLGFLFAAPMVFDFFEPGQVLENCDDLLNIFVNMEHSYLGDLEIQITCPDGTTVILLDYPNGGGATFLGEPVDIEGDPTPGVGYDYGWEPGLTNGTWGDNGAGGGQSLPEGFYESSEDMCALVGCPLNGEWSLGITDNLGLDDGNIFSWGISLNPELFPNVTTFTPVVGLGPDSTWWEGPFITDVSADGNTIEILPDALGEYEYTFFATNNFGCTFDTTVTVTVVPGPQIDAGDLVVICEDEVQLDPSVTENGEPADCVLTLIMEDTFGDGWNGCSANFVVDGVVVGNATLPTGDYGEAQVIVPGGSEFELVFVAGAFINEVEMTLLNDAGTEIYSGGPGGFTGGQVLYSAICEGYGAYVYSWTPALGLSDPNIPNPVASVDQETTYTVTLYPEGYEGCAASDQVTVGLAYTFEVTGEDIGCSGDIAQIEVEVDGDPGDGPWDLNLLLDGVVVDTFQSNGGLSIFEVETGGDYSIAVANEYCAYEADVPVSAPEIYQLVASQDTTICINGTATLSAWATADSDTTWQYVWSNNAGISSSVEVNPAADQVYSVYVIDNLGCESDPVLVAVDLYDPLVIQAMDNAVICLGDSIMLEPFVYGGGLEPYSFVWSSDQMSDVASETVYVTPTEPTEYCVTLLDACETPTMTDCVGISMQPLVNPGFVGDTLADCFPILVNFTGVADNPEIIAYAEWDFGDESLATTIGYAAHNYIQSGDYTVTYTVTTVDGCVYTQTQPEMIHAYPYPIADFMVSPEIAILPNTTFSFDNISHDNQENYWNFAGLGFSTEESPEFTFPGEVMGDYFVQLIVVNEFGCMDSVQKEVSVMEDFVIFAPNAFTPDHDGFNDFWFVQGIDVDPSRYELFIFNRWGDVVFKTTDVNAVWDGSHMGGDYFVPDGVYPFRIVAHSLTTGDQKIVSGTVTIVR